MNSNQMSIRDAARWADRQGCVFRVIDGQPDYMAAAVDVNTNKVLHMGFGDAAYDFKRAHPEQAIRVYSLDEVLEQIGEDEGEQGCVPGARDADAPWH